MKIAIDNIKTIRNDGNEYIYVFDTEGIEELEKLKIHCINYKYLDFVDINTTAYNINCLKRCKPTDNFDIKGEQYKFAIIIPNYNNAHGLYKGKTYLENCIESVLNQTYKNFDLIIVDDMSTDNSVEIIENYQRKDNRIHLVKNIRKRYNGGSRNVGIEYAIDNIDFDYFAFLDSDDWWKNETVLCNINYALEGCELMLIGLECIDNNGVFLSKKNDYKDFQEFFLSDNKVWCTAWCRIIRRDKIVYFCENTLMEDRVWSYRQADNVDFGKVKNLKRICYVWNRMNRENSVSQSRSDFWNASAYCHVGHQLQLLKDLKHKEMAPIIRRRVEICLRKINNKQYEQY